MSKFVSEELSKAVSEVDQIVTAPKSDKEESMKEVLETIKKLGKEGLKKAMPNLSPEQQTLLKEVLAKAVDIKQQAWGDANKKPQKAQEPLTSERSNSEEGVDEWDEKMMNAKNASQNHQGGSDEKPEGWEGQVIKAKPADREEAKEAIMQMEEKEHGTKDPKKLVEAEKKENREEKQEPEQKKPPEKKMKKSLQEELEETLGKSELMQKMVEGMYKRGMNQEKCLNAMKKKGYDHDLAKKMWDDYALAQEAGKATDPEGKPEPKKMEKSIPWGNPQMKLLGATTRRGQNSHYDVVDQLVDEAQKEEQFKKSGETFRYEETLSKGEPKENDINEIIANGQDLEDTELEERVLKAEKRGPFKVKSFSDEDMEKALGFPQAPGNSQSGEQEQAESDELKKGGPGSGVKGHKTAKKQKDPHKDWSVANHAGNATSFRFAAEHHAGRELGRIHEETAEMHEKKAKEKAKTSDDHARMMQHYKEVSRSSDAAGIPEGKHRKEFMHHFKEYSKAKDAERGAAEAKEQEDRKRHNDMVSIHKLAGRKKPSHKEMQAADDHTHRRAMESHEFLANNASAVGDMEGVRHHTKMYNLHGLYQGQGKSDPKFMEEAKRRHDTFNDKLKKSEVEEFEKGGKGSGVKGHTTPKQKQEAKFKKVMGIAKEMEEKGAGFFNRNSDGSMSMFIRGAHGNDPNQWRNARAIQDALGVHGGEIKPDPQSGHLVMRIEGVYPKSGQE